MEIPLRPLHERQQRPMCGIAGVLYADSCRSVSPSLLTDMGNAIAHRGPDGEGTFRSGPVGLVHRRPRQAELDDRAQAADEARVRRAAAGGKLGGAAGYRLHSVRH